MKEGFGFALPVANGEVSTTIMGYQPMHRQFDKARRRGNNFTFSLVTHASRFTACLASLARRRERETEMPARQLAKEAGQQISVSVVKHLMDSDMRIDGFS
jgi:hypothetical protein